MQFDDMKFKLTSKQAKEIRGIRRFSERSVEECALDYHIPAEKWIEFETEGTELTNGKYEDLLGYLFGLEGRYYDRRSEEEIMAASGFVREYGKSAWAAVSEGMDVIGDEIREDIIAMLGEEGSELRLTDLEDPHTAVYFPEQFLDELSVPIMKKLYIASEDVRYTINQSKLDRLHTVAEEMLIAQAARLGSDILLNYPDNVLPDYIEPDELRSFDWLFEDYLEDEDVMDFLYGRLLLGPTHPYHLDNWFKRQFWTEEISDLGDAVESQDYYLKDPLDELLQSDLGDDSEWGFDEDMIPYEFYRRYIPDLDEDEDWDDEDDSEADPDGELLSDDLPF